jgi:hypothetical protein
MQKKTNRWLMILFYNIIGVTAYNAFILWTTINPNWNGNKLTKRRLFLEQLGKELIKTHISSRSHNYVTHGRI